MTANSDGETGWFDAIPQWAASQRRLAAIAACCFVGVIVTPLLMLLLVGRAPVTASAPMPTWDVERVRDGDWMRAFERHLKESSHVTGWLRAVDGVTLARFGLTPAPMMLGAFHYESEAGEVLEPLGMVTSGFVIDAPWPKPRTRWMVGPGRRFYLVYSDHEVLRRPWFDQQGRVQVQLNRLAMRERELPEGRQPGARRVLCLGDSITFGWGVPEHLTWVRRLEQSLRGSHPEVSTINAGGAGTVCVDEYQAALEHRFAVFEPDAVVVATSCNDLMPSNGLAVFPPNGTVGGGAVLGGDAVRDPLQLDPDVDWVAYLRGLDAQQCLAGGYSGEDRPYDAMWDRGAPQRALLLMRDWCRQRSVPFVVAMWPFLQGLGPGRQYPFEAMHREVAAWCAANEIAFVDLLPALRDVPQEDLWVTPADMHPDPLAHALAARAIEAVLEPLLRR